MARRKSPVTVTAEVPEFLTAAQVADILKVSKQTLSYWRARDNGPMSERIGGSVRYPRIEFEAWLAAERAADRRGGVKVSA